MAKEKRPANAGVEGSHLYAILPCLSGSGLCGQYCESPGRNCTAETAGPAARLRWATASELDNARFEVEASADGHAFARVGAVAGHGTTLLPQQYGYLDENLARCAAPLVYYRLRQVDRAGMSAYPAVRAVAVGQASWRLYPNPATGAATLRGATPSAPVPVLHVLGRAVLAAPADALAGLPAGVHVVRAGSAAVRLVVE